MVLGFPLLLAILCICGFNSNCKQSGFYLLQLCHLILLAFIHTLSQDYRLPLRRFIIGEERQVAVASNL